MKKYFFHLQFFNLYTQAFSRNAERQTQGSETPSPNQS